jgi:hypothetical protein
MYVIFFFAFVVMCYIYFGADIAAFHSFLDSSVTLFLILLGDLTELDEMIEHSQWFTFMFLIIFMTSMQFILINMFIAFIAKSFSFTKSSNTVAKRLEDELKQRHWLVTVERVLHALVGKVKKDPHHEDEDENDGKVEPEKRNKGD